MVRVLNHPALEAVNHSCLPVRATSFQEDFVFVPRDAPLPLPPMFTT